MNLIQKRLKTLFLYAFLVMGSYLGLTQDTSAQIQGKLVGVAQNIAEQGYSDAEETRFSIEINNDGTAGNATQNVSDQQINVAHGYLQVCNKLYYVRSGGADPYYLGGIGTGGVGGLFVHDMQTNTESSLLPYPQPYNFHPSSRLIQHNGKLYGTITQAGPLPYNIQTMNNSGAIYEYDLATGNMKFTNFTNMGVAYCKQIAVYEGKIYGTTVPKSATPLANTNASEERTFYVYDIASEQLTVIANLNHTSYAGVTLHQGKIYGGSFIYDPKTALFAENTTLQSLVGDAPPTSYNGQLFGVRGNKIYKYDSATDTGYDFYTFTTNPHLNCVLTAYKGTLYGTTSYIPFINTNTFAQSPPFQTSAIFTVNPTTLSVNPNWYSLGLYTASLELILAEDPNIEVSGNNLVIPSNHNNSSNLSSISIDNFTDFRTLFVGSSKTHTFKIKNIGAGALNFGNPKVLLKHLSPVPFSISQQPGVSSLSACDETTFQITFNPTAGGEFQTWVQIFTNDPDSPVYQFPIIGRAKREALWGMTEFGGDDTYKVGGAGTIFRTDTDGNNHEVKYLFKGDTLANPQGSLTFLNGKLYGRTKQGSTVNGFFTEDALFEFNPDTDVMTVKQVNIGNNAGGSLLAHNGKLYGTTTEGGIFLAGSLFEYDPTTNVLTTLFSFDGVNHGEPRSNLLIHEGKLYGTTNKGSVNNFNYGSVFGYDLGTGVLDFANFDLNTGVAPDAGGLIVHNGTIYGTTPYGGTNGYGTLYKYENNIITTLAHFQEENSGVGSRPLGGLVAFNGELYGLASGESVNNEPFNYGTIFKYTPANNTLTKLHTFDAEGYRPRGTLTLRNGKFFGLTSDGSSNGYAQGGGSIFVYDPANGTANTYLFDLPTGSDPAYTYFVYAYSDKKANITPALPAPTAVAKAETPIKLYPNPATDRLTIEIGNAEGKTPIRLISLQGKTIWESTLTQSITEIALPKMPKGLYLMQIEQAGKRSTHKIIIE